MSHKSTLRFTKFINANHNLLSKIISSGDDGHPKSDSTACLMTHGYGQNVTVSSPHDLAGLINGLSAFEAISIGAIDAAKVNRQPNDIVGVVTARNLREPRDGVITRTTDYLAFQPDEPGFMLLDVDYKGMPSATADAVGANGGIWATINDQFPSLKSAGRVVRASTSAGISNSETGEHFPDSGGMHIYTAVADSADIPRALRVLHDRMWLAGYGWFNVGKAGQLLERSLVDAAVGSPERLIFEGPPNLMPPLTQDGEARQARATDGEAIDTRVVLPNLSAAEQAQLATLKDNARHALVREAASVRERADQRLAKNIANRTGAPLGPILEKLRYRHSGSLLPDHPLIFDDPSIGEVTVADVLMSPPNFIGETLADPLEGIEYGACKAKVMGTPETGLIIHSFAHGRAIYNLKLDLLMVEATLAKSTKETVISDFVSAADLAQLEPANIERLKADVAKKAGVGARVINNALKDRKKRNAEEKRRAQAESRPTDTRIRLPAPADDAELLATLQPIDGILSQVDVPEPPFRSVDGRYSRVIERSHQGLHLLRAIDRQEDSKHYLPAPPEPLISEQNSAGVAMGIEPHIRFESIAQTATGEIRRDVRLSTVFGSAYASWPDSKLPIVRGVSTLPIVLPGRAVLNKNGLHRELQVIFRVQSPLLNALPDPASITVDMAYVAYHNLTDKWLADVDTDRDGKAIIVALAMTLIQRHLLAARPAFFVTAGQRGGGKTTLLNMTATAVFGRPGAAANWSPADEERRKAIFSYFSAGVSLLIWDNIPRGEAISCPTIEKALTAAEISDRILGESRTLTVPATTVMAFTGNNISPKGDLASRSLIVRLAVSRADPENRIFQHPDPIGWTLANRRRILAALYTIMLAPRETPKQAKTRFKDFWTLVGQPIELVSGIDFAELFKRNDGLDEETSAVAILVGELRSLHSDGKFTAADFCKELNPTPDDSGDLGLGRERERQKREKADVLRAALEEAAGGKRFPPGPVSAHRVAKKLQALVDRTVFCGDDTLRLRAHPHHEGNSYSIQSIQV